MKPKNKFQKQIMEASKTLPPITEEQVRWAYTNCFEHIGCRLKTGVITCLECGKSWKSNHTLTDSVCGCTCPDCGTKLKIHDTRKRVFRDFEYCCIMTVCSGFQVLRFFYVKYEAKSGEKAKYFHSEVVQQWIAPDGRYAIVARLLPGGYYGSCWNFTSNLEIRPENSCHNIKTTCIYPCRQFIPELKQRGFNGDFYHITPFKLFRVLLIYSKAETLLKAGQTALLKHFTDGSTYKKIDNYWAAVKICIRNGYQIEEAQIWCDYIDLLRFFNKDLHNAKYVCPADLKAEHDRYVNKKQEWHNREEREQARQHALKDEAIFNRMKSRFFGMLFTDGLIEVRMLESVMEIMQESFAMCHCVFTNDYHLKPDSIILSAYMGKKRLETVEFSLSELKVRQSRGVCNQITEYHDRIINLVNDNRRLIKKRMTA